MKEDNVVKIPVVSNKPGNWIEMAKDPSEFINKRLFRNNSIFDLNIFFKQKSYLLCNAEEIEYVFVKNNKNYCKGKLYDSLRLSLGNGLVVSEGEFWKKQRRLMQPAFHKQILASFSDEIEILVDKMIVKWKAQIESGKKEFVISDEMMKLTLEIALKLLFGSDIKGKEERVLFLLNDLNERTIGKLKIPYNLPFWVPTSNNLKFKQHLQELHDIITDIIKKRRSSKSDTKVDLLQMLIDTTDADTGEKMTEDQLKDEALSVFIAGSETSATTLSWTFYLLTKNPEVLKEIETEVKKIRLENKKGLAALFELKLMNKAMQESMRIYPPVWMITREAIQDDIISGRKVKKGSQIYIPVRGIQNHPKYWDNPEQFSLARWEENDRPKYSYFPFGGGPRLCIGAELAKMEILLALYKIVDEFNFSCTSEVSAEPSITLRPKGGLKMEVTPKIKHVTNY